MINKDFINPYKAKIDSEFVIKKHLKLKTITASDAALIRAYLSDGIAISAFGKSRADKSASILCVCRKYISVPYDQLTYDTITEGIARLTVGAKENGEPYSSGTIRQYIRTLKAFIQFLMFRNAIPEIKLSAWKRIKSPAVDYDSYGPADILTQAEIAQLINACHNARDKAIIATLYETGVRATELCSLAWKDLVFKPNIVNVRVEVGAKHTGTRYTFVTDGIQYLLDYQKEQGDLAKPESLVFKQMGRNRGRVKGLSYTALATMIDNLKQATGITKPLTPKLFRTSRITNMIREGYPETFIKKMMWKRVTSKMFEYYLKLAQSDMENAVLETVGLPVDNSRPTPPKPRKCPVCGLYNPSTRINCAGCGATIETETQRVDDIRNAAIEALQAHPEVLAALANPEVLRLIAQVGANIAGKP